MIYRQILNFNFSGAMFFHEELKSLKVVNKQGRIHQCQFCEYSTRNSAHLKSHILTHTGERPFACALCDYKCTQKQNLKKHMLRHR